MSFPNNKILDSSKLKEFADNKLIFDENGRKLSKWLENTQGKGEIACYKQFLLFPQCFQDLYCRHLKTMVCLGKGYTYLIFNLPLSRCMYAEP